MLGAACGLVLVACVAPNSPRILRAGTHCCMPARLTNVSGVILPSCTSALMRTSSNGPQVLTAVENGGAGRSKMVALGCVDLP